MGYRYGQNKFYEVITAVVGQKDAFSEPAECIEVPWEIPLDTRIHAGIVSEIPPETCIHAEAAWGIPPESLRVP